MPNRTRTKKISRSVEEQRDERRVLHYQYTALHQTFNGELRSNDPDWLLLFRLHYSIIELEQGHPWLKKEDLA
jgi:hypothetical protein